MKIYLRGLCLAAFGLTSILQGLAAQADEKADALLGEVRKATLAAQTLSGEMSGYLTEGQNPPQTLFKATVKLKRPNFARIELTNTTTVTIASDGATVWTLDKNKKYRTEKADPSGSALSTYRPISMFFHPELIGPDALGGATEDNPVQTLLLEPVSQGGRAYQVVEITRFKPQKIVMRLYIGEDKLVSSMVTRVERGNRTLTREFMLSGVQVNKKMADSDFAYKPPANASPHE